MGMILAFLVAALWRLDVVGIDWDEARGAALAVSNYVGKQTEPLAYPFVSGGYFVSLMRNSHAAELESYLAWPFFKLFGVNLVVFRLIGIAFGALVGISGFALARRLAGERAGLLALFFILLHAALFQFHSLGFYTQMSFNQIFTLLCAASYVSFWRRKAPATAFVLGVLMGFQVFHRMTMVWLTLGFSMVMIRDSWLLRVGALRGRWIWLALGVFLGYLPCLAANWAHDFMPLKNVFWMESDFGPPPLDHAWLRAKQLSDLLFVSYSPTPFHILYALIFLPMAWFLYRGNGEAAFYSRRLFAASLVYFLGLGAPLSMPGGDHVVPVLALWLVIAAVSIASLCVSSLRTGALAAFLMLPHLTGVAADLAVKNGRSVSSWMVPLPEQFLDHKDPAYIQAFHLSDYFLAQGIFEPVCLSSIWPTTNLCIVSGGKVVPDSQWRYEKETLEEIYGRWLGDSGRRYYLFYGRAGYPQDHVDVFWSMMRKRGKRKVPERLFKDPKGKAVYEVFRLEEARPFRK